MSLRIGEHFILGFKGFTLPAWLRQFEARFGLGGVVLFDYDVGTKEYRNNIESAEQLEKLCREIHALASKPLICIDQEGGKVRRLKEKLGFQRLVSAAEADRLSDAEYLQQLRLSFSEMKKIGIEVDLMPVIDLNTNPDNPDIGRVERSYSSDLKRVERALNLCVQAAKEAQVRLCLKHYPGLGGASVNSHEDWTDLTGTVSKAQRELFYQWAEKIPGQAVLVSHGVLKDIDAENPLSVSKAGLQELRKRVPQAVLITDDLQMQGIQKVYGTPRAARLALEAGEDLLCIGNNLFDEQEKMIACAGELETAALSDLRFAKVIQDSARRVQRWKASVTLGSP